jgi:dipeptidyl aminopeptidase/acylaminoacyl peptidase
MQLLGVVLVCGSLGASLAPAKSPITHESLWAMKRVGAPTPSPDGKWVVFPVTEPAYDEKDQVSDLWIVATDGSTKPRRLTSTKGAERDVAWSPDSRRVAFVARREGDEASQIYVLQVAEAGEALRLTALSTGAALPVWSPDGRQLLFNSHVFPGAADDEANKKIAAEQRGRKYNARVYDSFPIRYWDKWLDDKQPHLFVQAAEPGAKARDLLAGTRLSQELGFAGTSTMSGQEIVGVWAPDGRSIVFAATTRRNTSAYAAVNWHLYQAPLAGAEPRQLTKGGDSYTRPVFRPDGRALYAIHSREGDKVYSLDRVAMFQWPDIGEPSNLTAEFDRSVDGMQFTPDSRTLYVTAEDSGHIHLYSIPASGGQVRPVIELKEGVYVNLASARSSSMPVLVANWESSTHPAEVVRIDPAARTHRLLSDFTVKEAAAIDWQPPRHFWFTSKRGRKIHNMIVLPPAFDESRKYPLFVLIHGGAHAMWRDQITYRWNYHLLAQPGYVILLTNYTGSTGFGEKFAQEIQSDPLKGPGEEINEAADEAIKRFAFIDASRQAAGGASYGGHLTNWLQATTTRYKCLISHAGLINLESQWGTSDSIYHREVNNGGPVWEQGTVWREQNPIRFAKNFRTPILLTVGENDFRVPLNQTLENWSVLQRLRIPSRLIVFPDENHWILKGENSRFYYKEVHAWLAKHLGS